MGSQEAGVREGEAQNEKESWIKIKFQRRWSAQEGERGKMWSCPCARNFPDDLERVAGDPT